MEDVSFCVLPHRPLGVLGQGGSGKSALAAALAGLLPLACGNIRVESADSEALDVRVLPEGPVCWPGSAQQLWETLRATCVAPENCAAWRSQYNGPMDRLPLDDARLELLRMLIALRPGLLVIDEPTLNTVESIRAWRRELRVAAETGLRLVLLSRHEIMLAACCEDLVILFDGRVVAQGAFSVLAPGALAMAQQRYGA